MITITIKNGWITSGAATKSEQHRLPFSGVPPPKMSVIGHNFGSKSYKASKCHKIWYYNGVCAFVCAFDLAFVS